MASHPRTATYQEHSPSLWKPLFSPGKWVLYLSYRVSITIRGETVCTPVHMHLHIHVYEIALLARAKKVSTTQVSVEGQDTDSLQHLPTGTLLNIPRKAVLTDACCDMGEWWLVLQEESQSLKDKQCDSADIKHLK